MADIEFSLDNLTLGELAMVEEASGLSGTKLLSTHSYLLALAVMVSASRNGDDVPSWQEISEPQGARRTILELAAFSGQPISEVEKLRIMGEVDYFTDLTIKMLRVGRG